MSAPARGGRSTALRALAFAATVVSTTYAGALGGPAMGGYLFVRSLPWVGGLVPSWWRAPGLLGPGLAFSAALLAILVAHEMGHFVTARRRGVPMSWPLFVPFLPPIGTLGAVIAMSDATADGPVDAAGERSLRPGIPAAVLLRVAAWGPFAGIVVALPIIAVGLRLSVVRPLTSDAGIALGVSPLFWVLQRAMFGPLEPGTDVFLHPVALAGWAGCLVTSLNLLPFGQLDGGHIAFATLGDRWNRWVVVPFVLFAATAVLSPSAAVFALFVLFAVGLKHPPITRGQRAWGRSDRGVALAAALVFVATFTPTPVLGGWSQVLR
ncbi:MAG: site-2 protease family protein [Myxococcales bacterium]|nr:site-2 protease family protein [Myxococcales bacterium]MCB9521186.1 site-2 protease family protein [Myxococcales bacterium]MCB9530544.1 site-2 protease family protein [Myxococcales bacterium]